MSDPMGGDDRPLSPVEVAEQRLAAIYAQDGVSADEFHSILQIARELGPEVESFEEFAAMLGFGAS